MTLLVKGLNYFLNNISTIIQWILFVIGSLLILLPIYHSIVNNSFSKTSQICIQRLGMHRFSKLYNDSSSSSAAAISNSKNNNNNRLSSREHLGLTNKVDTQVCLLPSPPQPSSPLHNEDDKLLISGLVNTGNSCFLNSVLQSLSALPKLQTYLDTVDKLPTSHHLPVTRSLLKTLRLLSIPSNKAFQPIDIVSALSSNRRVINREQQDAQELFQLISSELDNENQLVRKKQGFRDILGLISKKTAASSFSVSNNSKIENPFTGLLANRLSCTQCGYTEAIRHFSFNNVQLTLPISETTHLDDCLKQLTTMEYLNDVTCRKCSLTDTIQQLSTEIDSLIEISAKEEKLHVLQKMKQEMEHRLVTGKIDDDNDRFLSKVHRVSSKQAMFAKPPKILCLHIARSTFLPTGEIYKNTSHIQFPELLDLSPYCTNGHLNTLQPNLPISFGDAAKTTRYRLMSSIVHYGSHHFGHFIAYKRRLVVEKCHCPTCSDDDDDDNSIIMNHHDSDWFKISDERVTTCDIQEVLDANPYMLLYELIEDDVVDSFIDDTVEISAELSTIIVGQQQSEEDEEEEDTNVLPAAPPSSPLLLPHQLSSSIVVSSCSSPSQQPLITMPRRRRTADKKDLWQKTPVAIY